MHRELTVTALTPAATAATLTPAEAKVTPLRNGGPVRDQQQRIMVLEYEISCLKQAMSDLMMEKLILKVALDARYEPAQQGSVLALTHEAARNLSQCARNAGVYVAPAIVGTQLRANYEELLNAPMPELDCGVHQRAREGAAARLNQAVSHRSVSWGPYTNAISALGAVGFLTEQQRLADDGLH